jgi:integrase
MYEGGLRTEGTGAPSNSLLNPLGKDGLRGIGKDSVTGLPVGIVVSKEKGGKVTEHYISIETYQRLVEHISVHGQLESDYKDYLSAINQAAKATGQHASGRGTHGLKHNFAQERYQQCIDYGLSHEKALQQTSLELSHFRLKEALSYTKGS